jgi:WD40 repeat protein
MTGHPFPVLSVAFSPNGLLLGTGSDDGLVRLWRLSDGRLLHTLQGHAGRVFSLAFSPDGLTLATSADDFTVRLWQVFDGSPLNTIDEGMSSVLDLAFSPGGETLAWAESDGSLRLWNVSEQKWRLILRENSAAATSSAFTVWRPAGIRRFGWIDPHLPGKRWNTAQRLIGTHAGGQRAGFLARWRLLVRLLDSTLHLWRAGDGAPVSILVRHNGPVNAWPFHQVAPCWLPAPTMPQCGCGMCGNDLRRR